MATTLRTDIHRPSSPDFDPEAYQVFGFADFHETEGSRPVQIVSRLVDEGWSFGSAPHGSGQCSHCGARLRYAALMGHTPTKTLLYIGETCLDNRFENLTKGEFQALRKAALLNRERTARADKVAAFLAEYPDMVWLTYAHNMAQAGQVLEWIVDWNDEVAYATREEALQHAEAGAQVWATSKRGTTFSEKARLGEKFFILSDMWSRAEKWGSLSLAQVNFARKILVWISEAEARLVEREAATNAMVEAGVEVPEGKQVIEGTVLSTKYVENQFGGTLKMLVQHESGWKVWGTVPRAIDVDKGSKVRFNATVTRSNDDALFGFYSRPTKAQVL